MGCVDYGVGIELPDAGEGMCCIGAAESGPGGCTCWIEVHDQAQTDPDPEKVTWLAAGIEPVTRSQMCPDCAYRPGSPEKLGDPQMAGDADLLETLAAGDPDNPSDRFWCHQGIRRALRLRHPSGVEIEVGPGGYRPPIVDGVPYRADGQPSELCAGWAARRRALSAAAERRAG